MFHLWLHPPEYRCESISSLVSPVAVRGAESVTQPSDNTRGRPDSGAPVKTVFLSLTIHLWRPLNLLSTSFGAPSYVISLLSTTCKEREGREVITSLLSCSKESSVHL